MSRRLLAACLPTVLAGALYGCGAVLGIPGDLVRDDGVDAADELGLTADTSTPDDHAVPDADASVLPDGDASMLPDVVVPPPCDPRKELAAPTLLSSVSTPGQEGSPKLSEDELTIYFDAQRDPEPYWDLYTATRTSLTDTFGPATKLAGGVNTTDMHEFAPNVSPDELSIFFERQDPASGVDNFWVATRATKADPWGTAVMIAGVNLPEYQGKLDVRGDGSSLFFVKKGSGTTYHLWNALSSGGGSYVLTQLSTLNSAVANSEEYGSAVSKNGLVIYFGSTRTQGGGRVGNDVWQSTRAQVTDPFGSPVLVSPLNSVADDEPTWLSTDGCRLYMQSSRSGGSGMQDIYVATRPK